MPRTLVVLITGARGWPYRQTVWQRLDEQRARLAPGDTLIVVNGRATTGADQHAHEWVLHRQANPDGGPLVREWPFFRRPWSEHHEDCKPGCARSYHGEQGHRRNARMLTEADPEVALVFILNPKDPEASKGTKGCWELIQDRRIPAHLSVAYTTERARPTGPAPRPPAGAGVSPGR